MSASAARMLRRPLPFGGGGARHKVGARAVASTDWLELTGDDVADQLAEKDRLYRTRRPEVFGALPGSEEAASELLELVREALPERRPEAGLPSGLHPLEEAGRLVPEDFCVHLADPATGELILAAGSVCFPNRWRLSDKLGRGVQDVHGPVPGYGSQLGLPVDRLMDRLPPERVLERHNWGLSQDPELFAPGPRTADAGGGREWLRIERQTLRRLPRSGAVVFTIRTLQAPLSILRGDREAAELLSTAVSELPPDLAAYKLGSEAERDGVLSRLAAMLA